MVMMSTLWPSIVAALIALCLMPIIVPLHGAAKGVVGVQDLHVAPTSRLGGAIVFVALVGAILTAIWLHLAPARPLIALIACSIPVVGAGVWEDVTRRLPPIHRLLAAASAALLACLIADGTTIRLDIPYVDGWLSTVPLLAIVLTCFMVVGACNAINIVDGANGLASGTALMMFAGLAAIAYHVGDHLVLVQALAVAGALIGFLIWNYPKGRVFLGDGGAYLIGFIYAELSIQVVARNSQVSAWFVIMLAAYPIMETVFSMFRRLVILRKPSMQPDLWHLHSLVYRVVTLPAEQSKSNFNAVRANARVAPMLWLHGLLCLTWAVLFHDTTSLLLSGIALYCALYCLHYWILWKVGLTGAKPVLLVDGASANTMQSQVK